MAPVEEFTVNTKRDTQSNVLLRRMVVMIVNMKDAKVECDTSSIDESLWKAKFSGKND